MSGEECDFCGGRTKAGSECQLCRPIQAMIGTDRAAALRAIKRCYELDTLHRARDFEAAKPNARPGLVEAMEFRMQELQLAMQV